jgi:tetratricopeptide (TPR) repeat protein
MRVNKTQSFANSWLTRACMVLVVSAFSHQVMAQRGGQNLFGDIKINGTAVPPNITVILYKEGGGEVGRQVVSNGSRYRFNNLSRGDYELLIQADNNDIGRVRVVIGMLSNSPYGFQQDLEFNWKSAAPKAGVVSAGETYSRSSANNSLFTKAQAAAEKKKFDEATSLLKQLVESDKMDFQAWNVLGALYLVQEKPEEAERAYLQAIEAKPTSSRAQLNLGKVRSSQKKFEEAIEPLVKAVELQPDSGEANLLTGECYLQLKKGSKAIPYLNEAAKLGRPEAHLRLGWLYNAAGMKDKAALEYEEYLKKNPDYPDRNKLKEYISANKKS